MVTIHALLGDITTVTVDAVVNAANTRMRGGGGVDGAIHRAGGPAVLRDCIARFPDGLATGGAGWTTAGDLPARLADAHGVRIDSVDTGGGELRRFDPARGVLTIDRGLPPESAAFLIAHQLVRLEMRGAIAEIVANAGLRYDASRQLLAIGLANYAAGAVVMPYAAFRAAAHDLPVAFQLQPPGCPVGPQHAVALRAWRREGHSMLWLCVDPHCKRVGGRAV